MRVREYMTLSSLKGKNMTEIEVKSWYKLLVEEVLNPFYIFQVYLSLSSISCNNQHHNL